MPGRLFYRQEVFLGSMEEAHPIANVVGRCFVLENSEFISCMLTKFPEIFKIYYFNFRPTDRSRRKGYFRLSMHV